MKWNKKSLLYGTFVLTIANFSVRVLGFFYRVFLSRTIGPQGMGLFQLIFPLYLISITITASGIPIAVSRLVSQRKALNDLAGIRKILIISISLISVISFVLSCIMLFNVDMIARDILHDVRTRTAILVLFPCIFFTSLAAILKGFFYGTKDIHPPALSEIIEQIVRIGVVVMILLVIPNLSMEISAAVAAFGMVIGDLASLLYLHYRYHHTVINQYVSQHYISSKRSLLHQILQISIPVTGTRLISSLMMAANAVLIPQRLMASGLNPEESVAAFGIISGMTMPLLFLPFTITSALSVVIIPNISESMVLLNWKNIRDKASKSIFITCMTAFPSMALFISLGKPLGFFIYKQQDVGSYLVPLSFFILFMCLQHSMGSILNGLGKQNQAAVHFIMGGIVQLLCTYYLVADPSFKIYGFLIGFGLSTIIVSLLNFVTVIRETKLAIRITDWFLKPGLCAVLMGLCCRMIFLLLTGCHMADGIALLISFTSGILIFAVLSLLSGCLPYKIAKELFTKTYSSLQHYLSNDKLNMY